MKAIKLIFLFCFLATLHSCTKEQVNSLSNVQSDYYPQGDSYNVNEENPFIEAVQQPISTFSIDADGASYANVRRFIETDNQLPPKVAVRTEELLNYFNLEYPYSDNSHPYFMNGEVSECPWNSENKLIRIGLKGKPISNEELPPSNFVFLIDVSGSMEEPEKLELLKIGFKLFVDRLTDRDRVSIVTYAGADKIVLPPTPGNKKGMIKKAIDDLSSGGNTAGADGINTAYNLASLSFIEDGNNRIIIGTDGDFNVGPSSQKELVELIEEKRELGIYITVLGVGRGNLNDASLEQIANNGNGTYEFIDKLDQLLKVFVIDYSKFFTVAKDVKLQVEFNPDVVKSYRLIGYENRLLETPDFGDDTKDAGELGANQNVTALYEVVSTGNPDFKTVPTYTIKSRYKLPDSDASAPLNLEVFDQGNSFEASSDFMKFTASIAAFSMLITNSEYKGTATHSDVLSWLNDQNLSDPANFKSELKDLVDLSRDL